MLKTTLSSQQRKAAPDNGTQQVTNIYKMKVGNEVDDEIDKKGFYHKLVRAGRFCTGHDEHDDSILISWLQKDQKIGPCRTGPLCCSGFRGPMPRIVKPNVGHQVSRFCEFW